MLFSKPIKAHAPEDVQVMLAKGEAVLVDVREPDEHAREAIPGSHLLPLSRFDPAQLPAHKGKVLILHCKSGMRSTEAAKRCLKAGIADISHMNGGIMGWRAAGLPVRAA